VPDLPGIGEKHSPIEEIKMDSFLSPQYSIKNNNTTESTQINRRLKNSPIFKALRDLYRDRNLTDAIAILEKSGIKLAELQLFILDGMGGEDE
jgi:hypothetical protein